MILFIKGRSCPNLYGPMWKRSFSLPHPSLITARASDSRNQLYRACLTKWQKKRKGKIPFYGNVYLPLPFFVILNINYFKVEQFNSHLIVSVKKSCCLKVVFVHHSHPWLSNYIMDLNLITRYAENLFK